MVGSGKRAGRSGGAPRPVLPRDPAAAEGSFEGSRSPLNGAGRGEAPPPGAPVCVAAGAAESHSLVRGLKTAQSRSVAALAPSTGDPSAPRGPLASSGGRPTAPSQWPRPAPSQWPRPQRRSQPTSDSAPAPDVPPRAAPPAHPARPAAPPGCRGPGAAPRACTTLAAARFSSAAAARRPPPWTCTPRTGWGCPARGLPAAPAAGRPPSGTRDRGCRGRPGRGLRVVGVRRRLKARGVAGHGFHADGFPLNGSLRNVSPGPVSCVEPPTTAPCEGPWRDIPPHRTFPPAGFSVDDLHSPPLWMGHLPAP